MRGSQIADLFDVEAHHPITPRMINLLIKYGYTNKDFVYPEFTTEENNMIVPIELHEKITQEQEVWTWLNEHGSITDKEARDNLYISRLAARIYNLRHRDGYDIAMVMVTKKRTGRKNSSYAKYYIESK